MSLPLSLYEFDKRKNSTKVPTGTATAVPYVDLKESTSLNSPTFLLSGSVPFGVNYCEYEGAYYWIDDIVIDANNLWNIQCSLDPLATFATNIKATRAYIEYSSALNSDIVDPRPAKRGTPTLSKTLGTTYDHFSDSGSYIVTVSGDTTAGAYVLAGTPEQLMSDLYTWWNAFDTTDIMSSIKNLALYIVSGDVSQNIRDVRWIPWSVSGISTGGNLHLGMYDTGVAAYKILIGASHLGFNSTVSIDWQGSPVWKRNSQYMTATMYIPFIGNISLPMEQLCGASSLTISGCVDECTGDISLTLTDNRGELYGTFGSSTGIAVPIGGAGFTPRAAATAILGAGLTVAGAAVGAAGLAAEGVAGAGATKALAAGSSSLLGLSTPSSFVGGIQGASGVGLPMQPYIVTSLWSTSDNESNLAPIIGNPTHKVDTIGNYTYVLTRQASVSGIARGTVLDMINSYLSGGVYIE